MGVKRYRSRKCPKDRKARISHTELRRLGIRVCWNCGEFLL